jgi:hypothetical protein
MEVNILYDEREEKQAKEILESLEMIHKKRFFFRWRAFKRTPNMLNR